jgi:hypothetical protein
VNSYLSRNVLHVESLRMAKRGWEKGLSIFAVSASGVLPDAQVGYQHGGECR